MDTFTLFSFSLLSKWGFSDGGIFSSFVLDYYWEFDFSCHDILCAAVRKHLLPELEKNHEISLIDIETIHNPIRAEFVDGMEIDWFEDNEILLEPKYIELTQGQLHDTLKESFGLPNDFVPVHVNTVIHGM